MEQINQPRGAANEITSYGDQHQLPPEVPIYEAPVPGERPPVTFAEAETYNPFRLLTELHDHAMALRLHDKPPTFHLTELALSAAVVAWWSRWQPLTMHRAFMAGASLAQVAAAVDVPEAEAYERWARWADRQLEVAADGKQLINPEEVKAIQIRLGR